jgi:hypothetical protein
MVKSWGRDRLLVGRCLSALATALIPTTLTLAVLRATGSGEALGLVLACEMVPLLLFLPVGGVLADRLRPERVALLADLTRCLSQAAIAVELLLGVNRILDLAVLSAVAGAAIAFGSPAVPRLVVAVVGSADRLRVNARIGVATSLSGVLGPALAGTVTVAAGPGWAAGLTAVLFACSAMTLGGIRTSVVGKAAVDGSVARSAAEASGQTCGPEVGKAEAGRSVAGKAAAGGSVAVDVEADTAGVVGVVAGGGWRGFRGFREFRGSRGSRGRRLGVGRVGGFGRDLGEGWREVKGRPWFLACVLGHGVWHFMAGLFLTLAPVAAVQRLGGETSWMIIVQSGTVGVLLGVFAAPRLPIRRPLAVVQVGAACYLLPMVTLPVVVAGELPAVLVAVAYFAAMFGLGLLSPLWETVVAEEIPERALGRVRSFDQLISFASRPFGLAVAAPLAGVTGMTGLMVVGGVLVAAANLAAIFTTRAR